jgi:hypothetical protein
MSLGGPSGSPILMTVASCLEMEVLRRLGRLCCIDERLGGDEAADDVGELEYELPE